MNSTLISRRQFLSYGALLGLGPLMCRHGVAYASEESGKWYERARPLMGSITAVAVHTSRSSEAQQLIDRCFAVMEKAAASISHFEQESLTSRLNSQRRISLRDLPSYFFEMLRTAASVEHQSSNAYQLCSGNLISKWKLAKEQGSVLDAKEIRREQQCFQDSKISFSHNEIFLSGGGSVDVGGIGKGLVADIGQEFLRSQGIRHARIACSGDLRFLGRTEWTVEVEHPRKDGIVARLGLFGDKAVATSGDYRECWFVNGTRYHHLIDPRSGLPGRCNQSSTVIAPTGVLADCLASASFFLPPRDALTLMSSLDGVSGFVVDRDGALHQTKNLKLQTL